MDRGAWRATVPWGQKELNRSQHSTAGQAGKQGLEYHLVVTMPNDMLCC